MNLLNLAELKENYEKIQERLRQHHEKLAREKFAKIAQF